MIYERGLIIDLYKSNNKKLSVDMINKNEFLRSVLFLGDEK